MERAKATASRHSASRSSSEMCGAGAISITFWWRRWMEQSRSNRCITLPCWSARICTSMWRGRPTACSMKTVGSPKALSASRMAAPSASRSSGSLLTRRMPRPPPPATAFTKTGKPISVACAASQSTSVEGAQERSVGMPALRADSSARTLLPASSSTCGGGPMKVMPLSWQACARSGFSDRKP